jgi:hypothetical protein
LAGASKSKPVKYTDKSPGQPEMSIIFHEIRKILSAFAGGNYIVKDDRPGVYQVYYGKEVEVQGRKYPELCFVSLLIQKGYVGMYYFPVYTNIGLKKEIAPELLKCLKGKTCFHIKKKDPVLFRQIKEALILGREFYSSRGWK